MYPGRETVEQIRSLVGMEVQFPELFGTFGDLNAYGRISRRLRAAPQSASDPDPLIY